MPSLQPSYELRLELGDSGEQCGEIAFGYRVVTFVSSQIAFAPIGVKLDRDIGVDAERERQRLERNGVVAGLVLTGAIARCAQRDSCDPQQRVVCRGEAAFVTESHDLRVGQTAIEPAQQALDFVGHRLVAMQFSDLRQIVQAHVRLRSNRF